MTLRQPSSTATPTAQQPTQSYSILPQYNTQNSATSQPHHLLYTTSVKPCLLWKLQREILLPEGCSGGKATQIAVGQTKSFSFIKNNQAHCECVRASVAVSVESALRKTQAQRVLFFAKFIRTRVFWIDPLSLTPGKPSNLTKLLFLLFLFTQYLFLLALLLLFPLPFLFVLLFLLLFSAI